MKRLSIAITALAVVSLMTMVSCKKPNVINNAPAMPRTVTFNATTESSGGSRTTLDGLDVRWKAGDQLSVNGNDDNHKLTLTDGADTTFGVFTGTVTGFGPYLVGYPVTANNDGTNITFTIPADQSDDNYATLTGVLPMAAYTEDENADLAFKNMVNVLKLNLTGRHSLTEVEVTSTENLSGNFTVGNSLVPTVVNSGTTTNKITITRNIQLDPETSQTVYVVLPRFSVVGTVTLTFTGSEGSHPLKCPLPYSNTPNHRYEADVEVLLETPWDAAVVTIPVCAVHKNCASSGGVVTGSGVEEQGVIWAKVASLGSEDLTMDNYTTCGGGKYTHNYEYSPGNFTPKDETSNNTFTGFMSGLKADSAYVCRAYIRKGRQVKYGDNLTFTTLKDTEEPEVTGVDFGLPSGRIWAKCNLGAVHEYNYGDYYQWGDLAACTGTTPNRTVDCNYQSYRFAANSSSKFTKYCPSGETSYWYGGAGTPDNKHVLDMEDDCVRQTLGGDWRIPTIEEWIELCSHTTYGWDMVEGVVGLRLTGIGMYTGVSIFIPAAGRRDMQGFSFKDSNGYYWSSSLTPTPGDGWYKGFDSGYVSPQDYMSRCCGLTVRPVR